MPMMERINTGSHDIARRAVHVFALLLAIAATIAFLSTVLHAPVGAALAGVALGGALYLIGVRKVPAWRLIIMVAIVTAEIIVTATHTDYWRSTPPIMLVTMFLLFIVRGVRSRKPGAPVTTVTSPG